ncbi:alcohol dehydrogenase catalytic domain-containing protein [Citreicella sp. C3M06]|uniref:zinc-dependent alcohol dehydrogenase n=1 Tax=Citreicella sp. C3M06 TaxID=2841564 RepID=UPI001C097CCE|nr:alcohol dehydrogenase catalytic domain-containing protein [Citreicella sp. C3M06]MBU2959297.1 alcohol dehydrogenase catalytic domain-containing protein [Citreicella sp. C3M06]
MDAVRLHGIGDLRFERVPGPAAPAAGEVTLTVSVAGICGSDLHNYRTGAWISRARSIAGHEFTGTVTELGAEVSHVAVGDRVVVDSRWTCGVCPSCRDGVGQVCAKLGFLGEVIDGGFAQQVTLPARNVLKAPADVADRHLAMAEPLAVALHALNLMALPGGAELVVAGCGPIGALVTLLATRAGHPVCILDRNAARSGLLSKATGAIATDLDTLADRHFRYAIDTTGNADVISRLLDIIAGASRLGLVGIGSAAKIIDPVQLVEREIALIGCHAFEDELASINDMLPALAPYLDPFIADILPLAEVPAAYDRLLAGDTGGIKTLIQIGGDHGH